MLAYAPGTDEQVATRAGIRWTTLKGQLLDRHQGGPEPGILIDLARGLGLPERFAIDGWFAVEGWEPTETYRRAMAPTPPPAGEDLSLPPPGPKGPRLPPRDRPIRGADPEEDTG